MTPATLSLILWIPFALTVFITGLIHCISGYRQGIWRALVRLGCVVVATVVSILLARLIAMLAAPSAAESLAPLLEGGDLLGGMLASLVTGIVSMVASIVIFGILMLIFPGVLNLICVKIWGEKLKIEDKKLKLAGLAVGLVSAIVFSLFWLAPVYGTVATAMPVAKLLVDMEPSEQTQEIRQYVDAVDSNLLVQTAKVAPVAWVGDNVAALELDGAALPLREMADCISRGVKIVNAIEAASDSEDQTQVMGLYGQMVDLLREVTEKNWFYAILEGVVETGALEEEMGDSDFAMLLPLLDGTKDEVKGSINAVLDIADLVLVDDAFSKAGAGEFDKLYSEGLIAKLGVAMNATDAMVALKEQILYDSLAGQLNMETEAVKALLKDYPIGKLTDPAQQEDEAEVLLLTLGVRSTAAAEMIVRHPKLGIKAYDTARENLKLSVLLGSLADSNIDKLAKKSSKVDEKIRTALESCITLPLHDLSFLDSIEDYLK